MNHTVREYLAELERENPVEPPVAQQEKVSTTDPDSTYATKGGPARLGYYDNYLVDNASCVIVGVQATPARLSQESVAARDMIERYRERYGHLPQTLAADTTYGNGELLQWLDERGIARIPVGGIGGKAKAQEVNRELISTVNVVLFGNEEDFSATLGVAIEGVDADFKELPIAPYEAMLYRVAELYPNIKLIATTLRTARSATENDWGAIALHEGKVLIVPQRPLEILDRVGGGDSFASGLIYGLLAGASWALQCGVAHGALAMTTPGDTSMATLAEVEALMRGGSARIAR